jgi:integrase
MRGPVVSLVKHSTNPNGSWWADISIPGHRRIRKSLRTSNRAEAEVRYLILEREAWKAHALQQLKEASTWAGTHSPQPVKVTRKKRRSGRPTVTLQQVYERALITHYADCKDIKNVRYRWNTLIRFLSPETPVRSITRQTGRDVFLAMQQATWEGRPKGASKPYTVATINRTMALLGKLLVFARDEIDGSLEEAPRMPKLSEGKQLKRRPLRPDEYTRMVAALDAHENPSWRAGADFIRALWGTGCRVGELTPAHFGWDQVDFNRRALDWADTKGGHAVSKPMNDEVYALLKARRAAGLAKPFSDLHLHPFRDAWDWLVAEVLGITDPAERARLVPHSIRHSACTRVLRAGHSGAKAQRLLGHKTYATTQRYEHLEVDDLRDAAEALREP